MANPIAYYPTTPKFSRSPIYMSVTKGASAGDGLINVTLTLKIFYGNNTSSPTTDYNLFKTSINDAQIDFEISDLIREKIVPVLKTTTTSTYELSTTEGIWCKWELSGNWVSAGSPVTGLIDQGVFLVTDGWVTFQEQVSGASTGGRMVTNRNLLIAEGIDYAMPVYLPSRTWFFYRNPGGAWSIAGSYTPGIASTSRIVYFPYGKEDASTYAAAASPSIVLGDQYEIGFGTNATSPQVVFKVEVVCEPKYSPVRISFVNRYGVVDYITAFKASSRAGEFVSEQYMPQLSVSALGGPDITQTMQTKRFDVNATEVITLNTGWVDQDYDAILRELLMSEMVSLNIDASEFTVNPQTMGIEYQKHINDRNINYTLQFKIAWNILNNVR